MKLMIKPQKFASQQAYRDALFALLVKFEGSKKYLHIGPKGIPAIGPGVELIIQNKGYRPRSRENIDDLLTAAHGRTTKLSDADWQRIGNFAALLNKAAKLRKNTKRSGQTPEAIEKELKVIQKNLNAEMSKIMKGHGVKPFTDTGLRRLFDVAVEEAENGVRRGLRKAVLDLNAANKTNLEPDAVVAAYENSREFLSLASQRYNNIKAPKATAALVRGNRAEAYAEMGYGSNPNGEAGVADRRMAEAAGVAGNPADWTQMQKRQWRDLYKGSGKNFNESDRKFDRQVPVGGRFADMAKQAEVALEPHLEALRYKVQPGDTVGEVAKRLGLKPDEFMRVFKFNSPKDLKAGWTLTVPTAQPSVKPAPAQSTPEQQGGSLLDGEPVMQDVAQAPKPKAPAKPEITPEQEYMAKAITQEVDPVEHILLKPATVLTEKEVESMIGHDAYWRDGGRHPLGDPLQKKTKEFFQSLYPEPQGGLAFTPSEEPRPLAIAYDVPLSYGREAVADDLSNKAANSNIPDAVRGLQTTLNKRGYSNRNQQLPHLKEDGDFGPRTLARLDEELLRAGSTPVLRDLNGLSVA